MADYFDVDVTITDPDGNIFRRPQARRGSGAYVDRKFKEFVEDVLDEGVRRARRKAPKRSEKLARSIERSRVRSRGRDYYGSVGSNLYYAKWVEEGTGLHGKHHRLITAKRKGGFMTFIAEKGEYRGKRIFVRTTRGQRPQHYLRRGAAELNRGYIQRRIKILQVQIGDHILD